MEDIEAKGSSSILASTSGSHFACPAPSHQSDGSVHIAVQSPWLQSSPNIFTSLHAADAVRSSTAHFQLASEQPAASHSEDTHLPDSPLQAPCFPLVLQRRSSAKKSRARASAGDSLAAFLQEQSKVLPMGSQMQSSQPASGSHDLIVAMVMTESAFVPTASQLASHETSQSASPSVSRQDAGVLPSSRQPDVASDTGSRLSFMAADKQQECSDGGSAPGSCQMSSADLTGGAVMLQNPDGSVQYVVLTSDEQQAVQLSLQAKCDQKASTVQKSSHQVHVALQRIQTSLASHRTAKWVLLCILLQWPAATCTLMLSAVQQLVP